MNFDDVGCTVGGPGASGSGAVGIGGGTAVTESVLALFATMRSDDKFTLCNFLLIACRLFLDSLFIVVFVGVS